MSSFWDYYEEKYEVPAKTEQQNNSSALDDMPSFKRMKENQVLQAKPIKKQTSTAPTTSMAYFRKLDQASLNQPIPTYTPKPEPTLVQKGVDLAFNRFPSAMAGAVTESEKARQQGISEWSPQGFKAGIEGFKKGITGEKRYNFEDWLTAEGMKDGTAKEVTGGLLDVLVNPVVPSALKGGIGWAGKVLPKAPKLAKRSLGIGLGGGAYEAGTTYGKTGDTAESAKHGLEGTAWWGGAELGLGLAGKGISKSLGKLTKKQPKIESKNLDIETEKPLNAVNRQSEITKELSQIDRRIMGTKKSTTKYATQEAKDAHIQELQLLKKELQAELKTIQSKNKGINNVIAKEKNVIDLTKKKDITGFQSYTQDIYRNMRDFFGDDFQKVKKSVLDPFDKSKGKNINYQESWANKLQSEVVEGLGIKKDSKLSGLTQKYGEGQITLEELKQQVPKDWQKVVEADKWFRNAYNNIIDDVNSVRAEIYPNNPEKIVPKRQNYYRHFRDLDGFEGLKNIFDTPANIDPTLEGISQYTIPKSKFAGFMQRRGLGPFKNDAVGGFLNYLPASSYSIHIDPHISKFSNLAKEIAEATTDSRNANTMVRYLQTFSQDLAGKTNPADRFIQEFIPGGRQTFVALNWANNRVKANTVLMNFGSALSQTLNIPNGIAYTKQHSATGAVNTIKNVLAKDKANLPIKQSDFIKERYAQKIYRQFNTRMLDQPMNFATWLMETADRVGTEFIWNSNYAKALAEGISNPIKFADDNTRRLVAGRGVGEVPILQKAKSFQLVAPFQVEVGNLWKVQRDFIKEKDFSGMATLFTTLWLMNNFMESARGFRVALDPIDATIQAINELGNEEHGIPERALRAGGRLAGEALSNIPLGQTAAAMYPEYGFNANGLEMPTRTELFGDNDPTRFGSSVLLAKGIQDPFYKLVTPFGGGQLKKTLQGAETLTKEGRYKKDKLQYPVEPNFENISKGLLFGTSATNEAKEYYAKNRRSLSENQTKEFRRRVIMGENPEKVYESFMRQRELNKKKAKLKEGK